MTSRFLSFSPIIIASIVALVAGVLVTVFFQNTTSRILVQGFFSHDTEVIVSAVSADGNSAEIDRFRFKANTNGKAQYQGTRTLNVPTSAVQLEFVHQGHQETRAMAELKLTSVQVFKPYMKRYYFNGPYLDEYFDAVNSDQASLQSLKYLDDSERIAIRSKSTIGETNWALVILIPLLFFFGTWFLLKNTQWLEIPAFADLSLGNRLSSSSEFNSINGIRGLAALLVLLSHTAPGFQSVQMGLALLFVVSGFLLAKPFVLNPTKIFSWEAIERYVTKRLKRILPMYYTFIFISYVITLKFDTALRHFFFVQAEGHLWPMTQIFAFYMMLPFILLATCGLYRIHRLLPVAVLLVGCYLSVTKLNDWQPFYNGQYSHNFALYAFLMGVLASYIQYDWIGTRSIQPWGQRWVREALGIIALLITFYAIAWSAPMKPSPAIFKWISMFWVKCILSVVIILLTLNLPKTLFNSVISNPVFRSVGVVGFSFYLLHGMGIDVFKQFQAQYLGAGAAGARTWFFVAGAFAATYIMSIITYSYVERPFFGYREKKAA